MTLRILSSPLSKSSLCMKVSTLWLGSQTDPSWQQGRPFTVSGRQCVPLTPSFRLGSKKLSVFDIRVGHSIYDAACPLINDVVVCPQYSNMVACSCDGGAVLRVFDVRNGLKQLMEFKHPFKASVQAWSPTQYAAHALAALACDLTTCFLGLGSLLLWMLRQPTSASWTCTGRVAKASPRYAPLSLLLRCHVLFYIVHVVSGQSPAYLFLTLQDTKTYSTIAQLPLHPAPVFDLDWHPSSRGVVSLVTASGNITQCFWATCVQLIVPTHTGSVLHKTLHEHTACDFAANGKPNVTPRGAVLSLLAYRRLGR